MATYGVPPTPVCRNAVLCIHQLHYGVQAQTHPSLKGSAPVRQSWTSRIILIRRDVYTQIFLCLSPQRRQKDIQSFLNIQRQIEKQGFYCRQLFCNQLSEFQLCTLRLPRCLKWLCGNISGHQ